MKYNAEKINSLRKRYCDIVEIFKQNYFKFPLKPKPPPFNVIDGKPYTGDGRPYEPPKDIPRQDGAARFDTEIDILKAANISPETVSALTGIAEDIIARFYGKELGYQYFLEDLAGDSYAKFSAFGYLAATAAQTLCITQSFCDFSVAAAIMTIDKALSPMALPVLTGFSREALDRFLDDPSGLPASDKYILAVKLLGMEKMLERVRQLSGSAG